MDNVARALWYAVIHHCLQTVRAGFPGPSEAVVAYIDANFGRPFWERA